jgi:predicted NAD/FAD-binding protein
MKNIAIIGSGISGLTSAFLLSKKHRVTVFEKKDYIGGHTATKQVQSTQGLLNIDTGFIVFNERTYPNFLGLLDEIGVKKQNTEMSFSIQNPKTGLEYNGHNLNTLFAQRRNIFNPKFWFFIREIIRFNKLCIQNHEQGMDDLELTLGEFLVKNHFSEAFCENYILPMGAAIWSSSLNEMENFQLKFFINFFHNHGLLNIKNRPQWFVIPGGSNQYIEPLISRFKNRIELNTSIKTIMRSDNKVDIYLESGEVKRFDEIVFACHSDQALKLLGDPTQQEQSILGDMAYKPNNVILHTDKTLLPKKVNAWASWNYLLGGTRDSAASVTYNMNILQGLNTDQTYCVTLNQKDKIDPNKIIQEFEYDHPVFTNSSLKAQQRREEICGQNHTHFTGAYWYNGFHEDGVRSAVDVGARFNCYLAKDVHLQVDESLPEAV